MYVWQLHQRLESKLACFCYAASSGEVEVMGNLVGMLTKAVLKLETIAGQGDQYAAFQIIHFGKLYR